MLASWFRWSTATVATATEGISNGTCLLLGSARERALGVQ